MKILTVNTYLLIHVYNNLGVLCEIRHYEYNEAHLVEIGDKNYAIKAPSFPVNNFAT